MGNLTPAQNYDHLLVAVSGYNGMHDLQYKAGIASGQAWFRGSLVSLATVDTLKAGCGDKEMPLWAINATADYDVASDVGNTAGGIVATLVATGGYELKTTEFVSTETYAANDFLAPALGANLGKVTLAPADWTTRLVCGVVSAGVETDTYGQAVLRFWPVFLPGVNAASSSSN
jgi:hypothetical protein